ncbi:E3 ubiquitin-protein ligase RNF19A [Oryzias melastigma]|uniref:E3 ubiquitin-protein ligase RNF19A n=1 Tax=Oryzias melastigma TaxID=30732 RepID=A0A834FP62_ORYME|nr:E3 ubiquitin-protein ligase RNF19A [Oryzias melastigma]
MECPLCLLRLPRERFPDIMTCPHRSCADCLRQYLRIEISESRVNISCPECSERFNPHDIQMILGDRALMEKYEEFMLRRWLVAEPGLPLVSCPRLRLCGHCFWLRQLPKDHLWASGLWDRVLLPLQTVVASQPNMRHGTSAESPEPQAEGFQVIVSQLQPGKRSSSPSGCTFWGKKPWSRKKKILWQLGTLVGAPVGIALIAGIAIPAMIIGIPVYVGRKIHNRYEGKDINKHKRNLVIAGGVTLSVIVSPVVAAVTVGIGVPIMLAYVYGVVPISLCRSGGCGVSAGNGKGVRIEFDDENDNIGSGAVATDTTSVAETRLNNPSLGDAASRDNMSDNASTTALAGTSITGSLSGSCYNRMEVQADVQKERCSLSGESATVSLGTMSDNASTKAMAGSILNAYTPLERDNSLEVQADVESKHRKVRHGSASSSLDEANCIDSSTAGVKRASSLSGCCCAQPSNSCCTSEEPSTSGGKTSKSQLWKSSSSSSSSSEEENESERNAWRRGHAPPGAAQHKLLRV